MGEYSNIEYLKRVEQNRRKLKFKSDRELEKMDSVVRLERILKDKIKRLESKEYNFGSKGAKKEIIQECASSDLRMWF